MNAFSLELDDGIDDEGQVSCLLQAVISLSSVFSKIILIFDRLQSGSWRRISVRL